MPDRLIMYQGSAGRKSRRRHTRKTPQGVSCDLGELIDLSNSGIRLSSKHKPGLQIGELTTLNLSAPDGSLRLRAHLVWLKRISLRRFEMGFTFINVRADVAVQLDSLLNTGRLHAAEQSSAGGYGTNTRSWSRPDKIAEEPDYYAVLGVSRDASDEEIRLAFRTLARKYHPDAGGNEATSAEFARTTEAYRILRDPELRRQFDRKRAG
ncbi:MAG TPA: hypothetical protein ENJ06_06270 [Phycisphaeraceae bacterium]|nr:hypothetical protein [Phycisphaeraceae bacterium]